MQFSITLHKLKNIFLLSIYPLPIFFPLCNYDWIIGQQFILQIKKKITNKNLSVLWIYKYDMNEIFQREPSTRFNKYVNCKKKLIAARVITILMTEVVSSINTTSTIASSLIPPLPTWSLRYCFIFPLPLSLSLSSYTGGRKQFGSSAATR